MFSGLTKEQMMEIVDLQMKEVRTRLEEHGLSIELSDTARDWLATVGYDQSFGARPLKRAIQKYVESPLSVGLLAGDYKEKDTVLSRFRRRKERNHFQKEEVICSL